MSKKNNINAQVRLIKGTDRLSNGISLKAVLGEEWWDKHFKAKHREKEYRELQQMYKSQNNGKV